MILAIDYGETRCGLALGEKLAARIWTVKKQEVFAEISKFKNIDIFVVGLPLSMSGRYSEQTFKAVRFAERLYGEFGREVYMIDERLSSVIFKGRKDVDRLSAAEIFNRFISSNSDCYRIKSPVRLSDEKLRKLGDLQGKVLVANLSDVRIVKDKSWIIFQDDPYYAYLFHKIGCHIERDRKMLENFAPFDIIIAEGVCEELRYLLGPNGKILCL